MTDSTSEPPIDGAPYENNLDRLRRVVDHLEKGSLTLEESLALFEEGMALSRLCDGQLTAVEERVKVLVENHQELSSRKEIEFETILVTPEGSA